MEPADAPTDRVPPTRRRRLARRLAIAAIGVIVGLLVGEVAVRAAGLGTATLTRGRLYTSDSDVGWTCTPNLDARYVQPGSFDARVTTGADGLRNAPARKAKPVGVRRVVLLGDSMAWGYGVEDDQTLGAQLDARVPNLETVCLAMSGYSTVQQLIRLERDGLEYEPDIVVVAFTWNDLDDNLDEKGGTRPTASIDANGKVWIENRPVRTTHKSPLKQWLRHNSRLFNVAENAAERYQIMRAESERKELRAQRRARRKADGERPKRVAAIPTKEGSLGVVDIFGTVDRQGDADDRTELAWAVFEALLERIRDASRDAGARVILVNNAAREALTEAALHRAAGVDPVAAEQLGLDIDVPSRRLRGVATRLGIGFIDTTPAFRTHPDPELLFLVNNGHWSPAGTCVVAEEIDPLLGETMAK